MRPVDEEIIVEVCFNDMANEYSFPREPFIPLFPKLMEATRKVNEFVRRTLKTSSVSHPNPVMGSFPRKRPIAATVVKN